MVKSQRSRRNPGACAYKADTLGKKTLAMRSYLLIWGPVALLYLGFLSWHHSLQGPMSDDEVAAAMTVLSGKVQSEAPDANASLHMISELEDFLASDDGQPFFMINILEFRSEARYPDGYETSIVTASEANAEYARHVIPNLLARGSYPLIYVTPLGLLVDTLGSDASSFDGLVFVRYRSRRDFTDMITTDAFAEAVVHKWASLENTIVVPARSIAFLTPGRWVPIVLLGAGVALSLGVALRRTRMKRSTSLSL